MGYLHILNLYRPEISTRFLGKHERVYALEKVHGTSANVKWRAGQISYSAGGESHGRFVTLFSEDKLRAGFLSLGQPDVTVYGEAYGGKQQGMLDTYGKELHFIAFDVQVGDVWLDVPTAHNAVMETLGLEFVPYEEVACTIEALDAARDLSSIVARRRGTGPDRVREGVVIRPIFEEVLPEEQGGRLIAKHVSDKFRERVNQPRPTMTPDKAAAITEAAAIAAEWVTAMRLAHVLDKLPEARDMTHTPIVIKAMVEDVYREAKGEIVESKEAAAAIGKRAAQLFKAHVKAHVTTIRTDR